MIDGIINIYKPSGITSHDAVMAVRRKFKGVKVGHTGTLDPMAVGVLPICLGKATRITEYLLMGNKKYRCEMTLGIETDTQDIWGSITNEIKVEVDEPQIIKTVKSFTGKILQKPPIYSAVKVNGKRLYEYARKGVDVERESRNVEIYDITILSICENKLMFDVSCSKGTYIRTLCHDIGEKLGCGAVMSFLERTASGPFVVESTVTLEELEALPVEQYLLPMDYPLGFMGKAVLLSDDSFQKAINGNILTDIDFNIEKEENELYRIYYNENFVAIGNLDPINKTIKMKKVFKV